MCSFMSIMNKAKDLGDALVESSEYKELLVAQDTMQANEEAQGILQEFQQKQQMVQMMTMNGQEATDEVRKELEALQTKMQENEDIKSFMKAQNKFNQVMQTVNQVISAALAGEEEGGCGSHAGGCSGGCC